MPRGPSDHFLGMSITQGDISWQTLASIVHEWIGASAELAEVRALHGGSISTTLAITTRGGDRAVLKVSPHRIDRSYLHEAYQLNVLRTIGIPVPQVFSCKIGSLDSPVSYLLTEFIDGIDLTHAAEQCSPDDFAHAQMHLAELTLKIHAQTHSHYTRVTEGRREEFESWPKLYRDCYENLWKEAQRTTLLPPKARKQIEKIHSKLDQLLLHGDHPRLIHGDLWSSNVLAAPDQHGKWWVTCLLDPMCKYAHAESEIAYLELFKTATPAFLRAYQSVHRLPVEYHKLRKPIYHLYELINHLQLFGAEYAKPLLATLERLEKVV
jgi:fructosamine-3-kinase